ncbi:hypothetical protein BZA05DRAFT_400030 [Tricharina praecox]|uniref:uncharacterized protein n=1 Tax=Tricharina praecox TaxID=43433 RepID=UPI00221FEAF0|nr:uncharacterized protein BZA05DRAFT_400030 [Tricharina praecox]KAI5850704.1 hypothetical protein BZA05DRAFT_400030 [Tricharina praecox]
MLVLSATALLFLQFVAGLEQTPRRSLPVLARGDSDLQSPANLQGHVATAMQFPGSGLTKRQSSCPSTMVSAVCSNGRTGCCEPAHVCFISISGEEGCCPIGELCTRVGGCGTGAFQCAEDAGGGCCPDGTTCSTSGSGLCTPGTTMPPPTSTCEAGRFLCAANLGGGCCPIGRTCTADGKCTAATDNPTTTGCAAGRFECAANLGGGCCPIGRTCTVDGKCLLPDESSSSSSALLARPTSTGGEDSFTAVAVTPTTRVLTPTTMPVTSVPGTVATSSPNSNAERNGVRWGLGGAVAGVVGLVAML